MTSWTRLADVADCPPGAGRELVVAGRIIALFNVNGVYHALDGICPHQGGPLAKGMLSGCIVACPWHGWQFDVATGQHQASHNLVQPTYATKVEAGAVWIQVED